MARVTTKPWHAITIAAAGHLHGLFVCRPDPAPPNRADPAHRATMKPSTQLPNLWIAIGILLALFALRMVIGAALYDLLGEIRPGDPVATGIVMILSYAIIFALLLKRVGLGFADIFHQSSSSVRSVLLVLGLPILLVVVGANWWFADLAWLLVPQQYVNDYEHEMLLRLVNGGLASLVIVGVVGPVIEEIMFRGILLRGFLQHYTEQRALLLSAGLFAVYHLTFAQLPVAFVGGLFTGWLYIRSRSLWPCVVAHIGYNTSAVVIVVQ